jgi:hypothetical protein
MAESRLYKIAHSRVDLALAALLVLLGCTLFVHLSHALVTKL